MSGSTRLFRVISSRIFLVSVMGIFEYILEISKEANVVVGVIGVCNSWSVRSVEFVMLNAFGSGVKWLILCVKDFESF